MQFHKTFFKCTYDPKKKKEKKKCPSFKVLKCFFLKIKIAHKNHIITLKTGQTKNVFYTCTHTKISNAFLRNIFTGNAIMYHLIYKS